ncbi:MAG: potassium channel family protein [Coriobacteriia bacterium]
MAIVLVGSGTVIEQLVPAIEARGHRVVVITSDRTEAEGFALAYPGALVLTGDGRDPAILKQAGAHDASCVVAATDDDACNISVCLVAREVLHSPRVAGLAHYPQNVRIFEALDIACVSYSDIVADAIIGAIDCRLTAVAV